MRLIDADALREELIKAKEENEKEHMVLIDDDFMTLIHDAPTVDLEEIKHMYFQIGYMEAKVDAQYETEEVEITPVEIKQWHIDEEEEEL